MHVVRPNVKSHLVVTLVAFLATSLAIGDEGVVHHPHVMELLNMAPPSALNKRHLRLSPDVMSMDADGSEERAPLEGVVANVKENEGRFVSLMNTLKGWVTKNPDTLFASLKLHKVTVGLLSNTKFLKWKEFVEKKYGSYADEVIKETMIRQCEDVASEAMVIFGRTSEYLVALQYDLFSKWDARKITPERLLQDLNLGKDAVALINNRPLFQAWSEFAAIMGLNFRERLDILTKAYSVSGVLDALAATNKDFYILEKYYAKDLLQQQLPVWYNEKITEANYLKTLQINKVDTGREARL